MADRVQFQRNTTISSCLSGQVTALGPPDLLEKASSVLAARGDPLDRGAASAALRNALAPSLEPAELASFDAMVARLDALTDAVVAKVGFHSNEMPAHATCIPTCRQNEGYHGRICP